ncbi:CCA tRNA nucleotidyltransferase [Candidatus Nucleicultrix amoebiphila]|uniref:CCA tRNA nucleotidyltransferase n=1 Tax=Candidatus Nucleicultrix amoebiphila TaxID=1509244 RepID=UPI000A26B7F0|nr:CCA tRNA nucleotidyltransferase [Candidatus Nucleicultrix amoebiphila]
MTPTGKIPIQNWMRTEEIVTLFRAFPDHKDNLRFVGGCVRDTLLGLQGFDIDLATPLTPEAVIDLLKKANIVVIPTGLAHGTVTAVINKIPFEITTLRIDTETYGRHAQVSFTDRWDEDAKRRDFTFNALYLDYDGELYDLFHGQKDLEAGRVKFIGNPLDRIQEDYLRILRYFRFLAYYGREQPLKKTLEACHALSPYLTTISGERIHKELLTLLKASNPLNALQYMVSTSVFRVLFGFEPKFEYLRNILEAEKKNQIEASGLRRFYSIFKEFPAELHHALKLFRFSNIEKKYLEKIHLALDHHHWLLHKRLYYFGREVMIDVLLLEGEKSQIIQLAKSWKSSVFPVKGQHILNLGIPKGPQISKKLSKIEEWWVDHECRPTLNECLDYAKSLMKQ